MVSKIILAGILLVTLTIDLTTDLSMVEVSTYLISGCVLAIAYKYIFEGESK